MRETLPNTRGEKSLLEVPKTVNPTVCAPFSGLDHYPYVRPTLSLFNPPKCHDNPLMPVSIRKAASPQLRTETRRPVLMERDMTVF